MATGPILAPQIDFFADVDDSDSEQSSSSEGLESQTSDTDEEEKLRVRDVIAKKEVSVRRRTSGPVLVNTGVPEHQGRN